MQPTETAPLQLTLADGTVMTLTVPELRAWIGPQPFDTAVRRLVLHRLAAAHHELSEAHKEAST